MAGTDRHPLASKESVQLSFENDNSHFGVWVDRSWNSRIGRDGHFFDVKKLAALIGADEHAALQPWSRPCLLAQTLLVDDWHPYSFHSGQILTDSTHWI